MGTLHNYISRKYDRWILDVLGTGLSPDGKWILARYGWENIGIWNPLDAKPQLLIGTENFSRGCPICEAKTE